MGQLSLMLPNKDEDFEQEGWWLLLHMQELHSTPGLSLRLSLSGLGPGKVFSDTYGELSCQEYTDERI
jgi:hypothetical protein